MALPDLTLYATPLSGHCHRVILLLEFLGLPYRVVDGSTQVRASPAFRALNRLGQVPVLVDGDLVLADSNAILVYLAKRYGQGGGWLPEDPVRAAQVQRWLSVAAGEVRFGLAIARMVLLWNWPADLAAAQAIAGTLLPFVDSELADRVFLTGDDPTIADLACYSYIAHAPEGGTDLAPFAVLRGWLARVEALPGFVPMPRTPIPSGH